MSAVCPEGREGGGCLGVCWAWAVLELTKNIYIMIPNIQHRALRLHQRFTMSNKPNQSLML